MVMEGRKRQRGNEFTAEIVEITIDKLHRYCKNNVAKHEENSFLENNVILYILDYNYVN